MSFIVYYGHEFMSIKAVAPTDIVVRSVEDADKLMDEIRRSAVRVHDWIAAQTGDPLVMLKRMKFARSAFTRSKATN